MITKILLKFKFDFIDTVVVASYWLFLAFSFLSLFGLFNRLAVLLVLIILIIALFYFRKYLSFDKKNLIFFILTSITIAGFGFLRGFFTGDAYQLWLPVARSIVLEGKIPDFIVGYYFSGMPFFSLLLAATFSVFNFYNEFLGLWIPFFFTAVTLIVLLKWAKEKGLKKKYLNYIVILFLTNSLVCSSGWNLMQEALLLFFVCCLFYYYEKYSKNHHKKDLVFFLISFVLAVASKIIALFFLLLVIWLFIKEKEKRQFLLYAVLIFTPILFLFFRNYLVFGNPVFPLLNSIFRGPYANYLANSYFPGYLKSSKTIGQIFSSALCYLYLAFPFIVLSFWGFIKERKYEYLVMTVLFFFLKEIFYFTITISTIRYYYLLLGLLLLYSIIGLNNIKSRWVFTCLIILAIGGLLMVPIVDSTSQFISIFEDIFSFFGNFFYFLQKYWFLALIVLLPFIYRLSKRPEIEIFLILLYSLYILHLKFVANKSWLNTWPFIVAAFLILVLFSFKKIERYIKQVIVTIVVLVIFANSWAMAVIYYLNQGGVTLPVSFVWEKSIWARSILDQVTKNKNKKQFYILIAEQPDYFNWWTDYQAINTFDFDFWYLLDGYDPNFSGTELHHFFVSKKVEYIVKNQNNVYRYGDPSNDEYQQMINKINKNNNFKLLASQDNQYFVWQVY